jgi:hypothetical protein
MCQAICDSASCGSAPVASQTSPMAADSDIHLKVARQVIMRILLRLSPSSESQSDTDTPGKFNARESADGHVAQVDLEVRWMASGNTACLVLTSPTMCVSEEKSQV